MSNLRPKMTPLERAKQFMPFAALKGYEEALRKKEEEIENFWVFFMILSSHLT